MGSEIKINKFLYKVPFQGDNCKLCGSHFQKAGALNTHHELMHSEIMIFFKCIYCEKEFRKSHGAFCHLPKCVKKLNENVIDKFQCEICNKYFCTKSGVSQHQRHKHPGFRLQQRWEMYIRSSSHKAGRKFSIWGTDEIKLVEHHLSNNNDNKYSRTMLRGSLMNKTSKQLREKIRIKKQKQIRGYNQY